MRSSRIPLLGFLSLALAAVAAPRPGEAASSIFLEVSEDASPQCAGTRNPQDMPTSVPLPGDGPGVFTVYLLGTGEGPGTPYNGLTGFQFGIEYTEHTGAAVGMEVIDWDYCTLLEWRPENWPRSGSGNTLTWSTTPNTCQRQEIIVGGWFRVQVHGPSSMSVTGYPVTGIAKVANCRGAERVVEIPVAAPRLGWVAFGGAVKAGETGGCNPLQETCNDGVSPTRETTWGSIKALHR